MIEAPLAEQTLTGTPLPHPKRVLAWKELLKFDRLLHRLKVRLILRHRSDFSVAGADGLGEVLLHRGCFEVRVDIGVWAVVCAYLNDILGFHLGLLV